MLARVCFAFRNEVDARQKRRVELVDLVGRQTPPAPMPTWRPISQLWIRGGNDLEEGVADLVVRRDVAGS